MAHTPQAKKRVRQAEAHRRHNSSQRSAMRTQLKKTRANTDPNMTQGLLQQSMSAADSLAAKGLIHKNKAARHKRRLTKWAKQQNPA